MQALYQANALKPLPKIVAIGKNYIKHVKEMGGSEIPKAPVLFFKPWSTITYNPSKVHLPLAKIHKIQHEIELGVFISKPGSNIAREDVFSHIGGYFIGIDLTDRDFQNQSKKAGMPWALAKGQDNFCPISEFIQKDIDPYVVELELLVNGQVRQKDFTKNMHYKIDEMISYISQFIKLEEGDLILTGTPDGVGPVKGGDRVESIARIGEKIIARLDFEVTI